MSARAVSSGGLALALLIGTSPGHAAKPEEPSEHAVQFAAVSPEQPLQFPRDFGSHPQFRTEWWYVTGWVDTGSGEPLGFQVTFFRTRPGKDSSNPSAFTPHQLLIAHCAVSDARRGQLWHDQRVRRAGLKVADALEGDTHVWIDRWSLEHTPAGYRARIAAEDFGMSLDLAETEQPMLNGVAGVSRKGPDVASASYYYSLPHLRVTGVIERGTEHDRVTGEAWLDHEWSSEYLDAQSVGWDWVGINLDDGSALMAFRIRAADGSARWAGGSFRGADGRTQTLAESDVRFDPRRQWISPRTGTRYPVEWRLSAAMREYDLEPLFDDQENDTRLSTGAVYWEGAIRAYEHGRLAGRGYLELTGYGDPLDLSNHQR